MDSEIDINRLDQCVDDDEEREMMAEYNERFEPRPYRPVFSMPSGEWRVDASFPDSFFEAAKLLVQGVCSGQLHDGIEGVPAIFLSRHYLELALKYVLFHSRWLKDGNHNVDATDKVAKVGPPEHRHDLQKLWKTLSDELKKKPDVVARGLDLDFIGESLMSSTGLINQIGDFVTPVSNYRSSLDRGMFSELISIRFCIIFNAHTTYSARLTAT